MIKLIGGVLVAGGFSAAGLLLAGRLNKRVRLLAALLAVLHTMRDEIGFGQIPLPELLTRLAGEHPSLSPLWDSCIEGWKPWDGRSFADCWNEGLGKLDLHPDEEQILMEAGSLLGRYDSVRQAEGLELTASRLQTCWGNARDDRDRGSRTLGGLGIICGLAAVVLLL